jgi:F-type H+-transporting ATPase subunit c
MVAEVATAAVEVATVATAAVSQFDSFKYIGAGLCALGMAGAAIGIGNIFGSFFNSIARNPSAANELKKYIYIAAAFAEAMGVFALIVAILIMK